MPVTGSRVLITQPITRYTGLLCLLAKILSSYFLQYLISPRSLQPAESFNIFRVTTGGQKSITVLSEQYLWVWFGRSHDICALNSTGDWSGERCNVGDEWSMTKSKVIQHKQDIECLVGYVNAFCLRYNLFHYVVIFRTSCFHISGSIWRITCLHTGRRMSANKMFIF